MNSISWIPAVQYEYTSFDGEKSEKIKEIFIPNYNYIINSKDGLFRSESPRNIWYSGGEPVRELALKKIDLPLVFVEKIASFAKLKFEVLSQEKQITTDLKNLLVDPESFIMKLSKL